MIAFFASAEFLNFFVNFISSTPNAELNIKAVKLELGSVSTLANDVAPNYAEELAKCQRFYYRATAKDPNRYARFGGGHMTASTAYILWHLLVPLRTTKNTELRFNYSGSFGIWAISNSTQPITSMSISTDSILDTSLLILCSGSFVNDKFGILSAYNSIGAYLEISADL